MADTVWRRSILLSDTAILLYLALFKIVLHLLTNGDYGFFRDELAYLDDAKHLAWGYVDHPPLAPFLGRIELMLFGETLSGFRFFNVLAGAASMFLAGLMAREFGGGRLAQVIAALCVLIAPAFLLSSVLFQHVPFDQFFWVLCSYFVVRLIKTENPRWWLGIGLAIGLGMMTKYTMLFYVVGLGAGILLTTNRKYLLSPWLWLGAGLALLIFLPNLIWLAQHQWISLDYLNSINARDAELGRTQGFIPEQFIMAHPFTTPVWIAGLYFLMISEQGRRFRVLGWIYLVTLALFIVLQGRSYYLAPAYPMLLAGGAVVIENFILARQSPGVQRGLSAGLVGLIIVGGVIIAPLMLPITPVDSDLWHQVSEINGSFPEMIGWEELTQTVADIYQQLPTEEQAQTAVLAGNYGEAGAINLYGSRYGLPKAISPANTYYLWGYGDPPPQTLIVLGFSRPAAEEIFTSCDHAGTVSNRYDVENEETEDHPDIFLCRDPRQPFDQLWEQMQRYG